MDKRLKTLVECLPESAFTDVIQEEIEKVCQERDELAANVDRLREVCLDILDEMQVWEAELGEHPAATEAREVLSSTPKNNLAKLKAEAAEHTLTEAHTKLSERREWAAAHHLLLVSSGINERLRQQADAE